jgi:hypothetical protein
MRVLSSTVSFVPIRVNVLVVRVLQSQACGINRFVTASQCVSLAALRVPRIYLLCWHSSSGKSYGFVVILAYWRTVSTVVDFIVFRQLSAVGEARWGSQWRHAWAALWTNRLSFPAASLDRSSDTNSTPLLCFRRTEKYVFVLDLPLSRPFCAENCYPVITVRK